jgi:putative restriction endonuclease
MEGIQQSLQKYLQVFKKLRIDRSHGIAPHKPILLLSVLQTYHSNFNTSPKVYITPELVALFKTNWNQLVHTNHDCRISYPFYYLKSDKFWTLIPKSGFENINNMGSIMKTFSNLNAAVDFALIAEDLFELVTDKRSNDMLQQFLLDEYFPSSRMNFSSSNDGQAQLFNVIEQKLLHETPADYRQEIKNFLQQHNEEEIFLRGSLFKREIPKIYNNTCCISGMRIDTAASVSMIDACHIIPFSVSYDDTVTNGIALCPNLHRAFDRGLIAVDSEYKVVVSPSFLEGDTSYSIRAFDRVEIKLPKLKSYYPLRENFEWHRINVFR